MYNTKTLFNSLDIGLVFSPFSLSDKDRVIIYEYIKPDETIQAYLERVDIVVPGYMQNGLRVNGITVPFELWHKTTIKEKAFITIAPNAGDPFTVGAVLGAVFLVGLVGGGMMLINNLSRKDISQSQGINTGGAASASPTYSITGGSNRSRPFEPMPLVLGKHLLFPDLAITPYTRIEGSNQFLYQIFNCAINELTLSDIKIGETDISAFNEAKTEISPFATGKINLFPATTLVVEGAVLEPSASEFTLRTSAENATALIVDLELQLTRVDPETGAFIAEDLELVVQVRLVETVTWTGFVTTPQQGVTITGTDSISIHNKGNSVVRRSLYLDVTQGQYEVQIRRVPSALDDSSSSNRSVNWIQLLSMQPDEANYENRIRIGLRIRATAQLSGIVDQLSVIVSNIIPVWNGATEVLEQSSNPGHLYIWFLRGAFNSDGRKRFGAGLIDNDIDLDGLRTWADWCDTNNLTFNAIIDSPKTVFETLQLISAAGRASPQLSLTQMSVVYDEENRLPIQAFGMASIIKDSFKVSYLSDNIPTEIVVKYIDAARNYERNEVRQEVFNLENEGVVPNPVDFELFGVTNLEQAGREANLIAASYVFRRRLIEFTVDIENIIAVRGDVVLLGHDLTSWSDSGRLISGTASQLILDKEVTVGADSFITIRDPNINLTTHTATSSSSNPTNVIDITPSLSSAPNDNTTNQPKDYIWFFEDDSQPGLLVKITDIKTQDNLFATITCVEDNINYYFAENDDYVFTDPFLFNGGVASVKNILFSETLLSLSGATELNISWTTTQAESVDVTVSLNEGDLETFSGIKTNALDINTTGGDIVDVIIQVNAIVELRSSQLTEQGTYQVLGLTALPDDVSSFSVARNLDTLSFKWDSVSNIDLKYYEIRRGGSWKASTLVAQVNANVLVNIDYAATTFLIKAVDLGLRESETAAFTSSGLSSDVNIIFSQAQENLLPPWDGILTDLIVDGLNQLTLASSVSFGTYITNSIDIGAVNVSARVDVLLLTSLDIPGYTWLILDEPWVEYGDITWAGDGNPADFTLFIATSDDDITFSDFEIFVPGSFNARFYKFQLDISKEESSSDIPTVQSMVITIDVKDIIVLFNEETVLSTGRTFTFDEMNIVPNTQATLVGGLAGDLFVISSATTSSVFIQVFDAADNEKQAVVNLNIHGY